LKVDPQGKSQEEFYRKRETLKNRERWTINGSSSCWGQYCKQREGRSGGGEKREDEPKTTKKNGLCAAVTVAVEKVWGMICQPGGKSLTVGRDYKKAEIYINITL